MIPAGLVQNQTQLASKNASRCLPSSRVPGFKHGIGTWRDKFAEPRWGAGHHRLGGWIHTACADLAGLRGASDSATTLSNGQHCHAFAVRMPSEGGFAREWILMLSWAHGPMPASIDLKVSMFRCWLVAISRVNTFAFVDHEVCFFVAGALPFGSSCLSRSSHSRQSDRGLPHRLLRRHTSSGRRFIIECFGVDLHSSKRSTMVSAFGCTTSRLFGPFASPRLAPSRHTRDFQPRAYS